MLISELNGDKQTKITTYTFDKLSKSSSPKGSKYSDSSSRTSNDSGHSEKQSLLAIQNENRARCNLELLKIKQKLKKAEANEELKQAKEKCASSSYLLLLRPKKYS